MWGFENFDILSLPGENEIYKLSGTTQTNLCSLESIAKFIC